MNNDVEEIKSKIDIVDFIGSFIALKKAGRNFKGVCPFHHEKTPSFVVSPERQIWHCFGACGDGGDAIKFLMKWENITFIEAVKELADKLGIKLKGFDLQDREWQKKERLIGLNNLVADFYSYVLWQTQIGKKAMDYLHARKLNPKIIKTFTIGYAPASWESLVKFLKKKNYNEIEMYDAGVIIKNEQGRFYDRFRGRLMFPIRDMRGNVIGFSGRLLEKDDTGAKYINTPETLLYRKRESLFGIHLAKEAIKKTGSALLVEGEFDMITPYQHAIENVVAIKGSAVTKEQLFLLKRFTNRVNLALDADDAGEEAIKRGIAEAENLDFDIGIISIDYAKDPDEAVLKDLTKFRELIKKPLPIYDFIINFFAKKYSGDDPFSKKKLADGVAPYLAEIKNPIVHSYMLKKLTAILQVDERSIDSLLSKYRKQKQLGIQFRQLKTKAKTVSREIVLQKYLLSLIFQSDKSYELADKVLSILSLDDLSIESYRKTVKLYLQFRKKNPEQFIPNRFTRELPDELKPVFDEIYLFASAQIGLEQNYYLKIAVEIKEYLLKKKISESFKDELTEKEEETLLLLNKELNQLEKTRVSL